MSRSRILVVEDEQNLQTFYCTALAQAGYRTCGVRSGKKALSTFANFSPDLVILDLGLEGDMDGFEVLAALRRQSDVRIMILTGQSGDAKLVRGLNLGADNYILKPVSRAQLAARVQAQLRRRPNGLLSEAWGVYRYGELVIDLDQSEAVLRRRRVTFGDVEIRILSRLLRTPDQPVMHRELLELGWGLTEPVVTRADTRVLFSCLYRIRDKLDRLNRERRLIRTVPNVGFAIGPPDAAPGIYRYGNVTIDLGRGLAVRDRKRVTFGAIERCILARLLQTPGQPVTHQELLEIGQRASDSEANLPDVRLLQNCLYRLRDKLMRLSDRRRLIANVPNVGFAIARPDVAPITTGRKTADE